MDLSAAEVGVRSDESSSRIPAIERLGVLGRFERLVDIANGGRRKTERVRVWLIATKERAVPFALEDQKAAVEALLATQQSRAAAFVLWLLEWERRSVQADTRGQVMGCDFYPNEETACEFVFPHAKGQLGRSLRERHGAIPSYNGLGLPDEPTGPLFRKWREAAEGACSGGHPPGKHIVLVESVGASWSTPDYGANATETSYRTVDGSEFVTEMGHGAGWRVDGEYIVEGDTASAS